MSVQASNPELLEAGVVRIVAGNVLDRVRLAAVLLGIGYSTAAFSRIGYAAYSVTVSGY